LRGVDEFLYGGVPLIGYAAPCRGEAPIGIGMPGGGMLGDMPRGTGPPNTGDR